MFRMLQYVMIGYILVCAGEVEAKPASRPSGKSVWRQTQAWSLPQGPYLWEVGTSYGLVGHVLQGRVTVFDTQSWKLLGSKRLGRGQVYVAVQGQWGLVALTTQKKLLLVKLPSLRVHRSYELSFYPYGVHLEASFPAGKPVSQPTSKPRAPTQKPPEYALIADQIGSRLVRLHLSTGKIVRSQEFQWPLRTRWARKFGILIPISGPLLLLRATDWRVLHRWKLPGVAGDVALQGNRLALAYGDGKRSHGSLHLYHLPNTKPLWQTPTYARPRSIALAGSHVMTLSEKGKLQVFTTQGQRIQSTSLGKSGLVLRCTSPTRCTALLPLERKLVRLNKAR